MPAFGAAWFFHDHFHLPRAASSLSRASTQRALLRVGGAAVGSMLALFMVVFVIPQLDGIVGLLLMSLPVIALGAWVSAGSERIRSAI